jgi:hypothetical protein
MEVLTRLELQVLVEQKDEEEVLLVEKVSKSLMLNVLKK